MPQAIRITSLLSPILYGTYTFIAEYLAEQLRQPTSLYTGQSLAEFTEGRAEIGFLCGLLYTHLRQTPSCPCELLVAPVLQGERYGGRPIYFSDLIVRRTSPYTTFEDLRGCAWAYNERASHSGYNLVYYSLLQHRLESDYFARSIETGSHQQSIQTVINGQADTAAIDSHILDVLWQQPEIHTALRRIASLGPSPIPPLIIAKNLESQRKQQIREILLNMHQDARAAEKLKEGQIQRFIEVTESDYDLLQSMYSQVQRRT